MEYKLEQEGFPEQLQNIYFFWEAQFEVALMGAKSAHTSSADSKISSLMGKDVRENIRSRQFHSCSRRKPIYHFKC